MNPEHVELILEILSSLADLLTIVASAIAIFVYFTNRNKIAATINLLLNYSFQTTLSELKEKLERLNEHNANDANNLDEIRGILHEIAGQIRGNSRLVSIAPGLYEKVERIAESKKLTEPMKRSIVSELREKIRNIQVRNIDDNIGN